LVHDSSTSIKAKFFFRAETPAENIHEVKSSSTFKIGIVAWYQEAVWLPVDGVGIKVHTD